jgi:hypothetical protein
MVAILLPPSLLIANAVEGSVMGGRERDRPLITDLSSESTGLGKAQMVGLGWRSSANNAGLCGDIAEVLFVADPPWRVNRQVCLVDVAVPGVVIGFALRGAA